MCIFSTSNHPHTHIKMPTMLSVTSCLIQSLLSWLRISDSSTSISTQEWALFFFFLSTYCPSVLHCPGLIPPLSMTCHYFLIPNCYMTPASCSLYLGWYAPLGLCVCFVYPVPTRESPISPRSSDSFSVENSSIGALEIKSWVGRGPQCYCDVFTFWTFQPVGL